MIEQWVRVEVAPGRAYTYRAPGSPLLHPGDYVWCPANDVQDRPFQGQVLRVLKGPDPDFDGPYKEVELIDLV